MPMITYIMPLLDTLKLLEGKPCIKFYKQCFKHVECNSPYDLSFFKPLFSRFVQIIVWTC